MSELGFTSPREMAAALFIIGGLIFFIGSGIGMLRLPDFYSRIHASGNSETLGCMLTFIGLMIYAIQYLLHMLTKQSGRRVF